VAFGRDYIANPDLVARLQKKAALNPQRPESFYGGGAEGYPITRLYLSPDSIDSGDDIAAILNETSDAIHNTTA
jgi:hypothetical protein